jgi:hypothetical protein
MALIVKVSFLFLKTAAKQVAKTLKSYAERPESKLLHQFCLRTGQLYNRVHIDAAVRAEGLTCKNIKALQDKEAMKAGTEFLGESFIFMIGAGIYYVEHLRSTQKKESADRKKEARRTAKHEVGDFTIPRSNNLFMCREGRENTA